MKARELHARMKAAATAFRLAGGRNPCVEVRADGGMTIVEAVNSTNADEAARTQASIEQRLGGGRSPS